MKGKPLFLALVASIFSIYGVYGQQLRAEFAMSRFDCPTEGSFQSQSSKEQWSFADTSRSFGPYLETYLKLKGNTIVHVESDSGRFAEVAISYVVTKNEKVVYSDAYRLKGPVIPAGALEMDFIDQQRFFLKAGKYKLVLRIKDINNADGIEAVVTQDLVMEKKRDWITSSGPVPLGSGVAPLGSGVAPFGSGAVPLGAGAGTVTNINPLYYISDVQVVDSYYATVNRNILSKGGFDLVPYTSDFYPQNRNTLDYYFEVYNTDKRVGLFGLGGIDNYLITTHIENADDLRIIDGIGSFVKKSGQEVVPILQSLPIDRLPSGNYHLVIELKDRKNEVIDRKMVFFQRSNTILDSDSSLMTYTANDISKNSFTNNYHRAEELEQHVRCLAPIATQKEIQQMKMALRGYSVILMRRYLHDFWTSRFPETAEEEWKKYLVQVQKVNANYSNNLTKGYDTDRGRVYLQYGPPNTIADSYFEPNTYPYEIWHYYKLENRNLNASDSNKRFVFANTSPGSNEFILLHSDADNEQNNARWHFDLQKRNEPNTDLDEEQGRSHNGSRALQYYNNPR